MSFINKFNRLNMFKMLMDNEAYNYAMFHVALDGSNICFPSDAKKRLAAFIPSVTDTYDKKVHELLIASAKGPSELSRFFSYDTTGREFTASRRNKNPTIDFGTYLYYAFSVAYNLDVSDYDPKTFNIYNIDLNDCKYSSDKLKHKMIMLTSTSNYYLLPHTVDNIICETFGNKEYAERFCSLDKASHEYKVHYKLFKAIRDTAITIQFSYNGSSDRIEQREALFKCLKHVGIYDLSTHVEAVTMLGEDKYSHIIDDMIKSTSAVSSVSMVYVYRNLFIQAIQHGLTGIVDKLLEEEKISKVYEGFKVVYETSSPNMPPEMVNIFLKHMKRDLSVSQKEAISKRVKAAHECLDEHRDKAFCIGNYNAMLTSCNAIRDCEIASKWVKPRLRKRRTKMTWNV
jgi:hypothetical protein